MSIPSGISTRRESGETLVETLLAVMILGVAVSGVIGAVMMATGAAALSDQTTETGLVLRSWAEKVSLTDYVQCRAPSQVTAAPEVSGWGGSAPSWTRSIGGVPYTATVTDVKYWKSDNSGFGPNCGTDNGVQRVFLEVSAPGLGMPGTTKSLAVTVRNPCTSTDPEC